MSKDIIKTPHYYTRCPMCGCHFTFEVEDFKDKNGYNDTLVKDYTSCPYCREMIQVRDKNLLLSNVKVIYTGGKLTRKTVTVADFSFLEDRYESVSFWAQKRDDEYEVDYVFEIHIKDENPTTISTVDKAEARLWATQLNIDLKAWEQEIKEVSL